MCNYTGKLLLLFVKTTESEIIADDYFLSPI